MLKECQRYLDTNIYRSFNILKTNYAQYFKHFDKGFKESIGVKIDNELTECIKMMSYSYRINDINKKLEYANKKLTKVMIYQDYCEIHKRKHKYYNQVNHNKK